jgi:MFS family permease
MFPLLIGLIGSSIISGQIISRTGKYKALIAASIAIMAIGIFLMTHITADVDLLTLYAWMFITGIGIGPTLAAFTIVVQNAVPFSKLGVATSNLTFFRQIGGSVGLAIAGTVFGQALQDLFPGKLIPVVDQMKAALPTSQVPLPFQPAFATGLDQFRTALASGGTASFDTNQFAGVGQSFGHAVVTRFASQAPAQAKPIIDGFFGPFVPKMDQAFFDAFSLAIGRTFEIAVVTCVLAVIATLFMRELALRKGFGPQPGAAPAEGETGAAPFAAMH